MKKVIKALGGFVIILLVVIALFASMLINMEHNKDIPVSNTHQAKVVIFYKASCPDCRKDYPIFYLAHVVKGKKVLLVNLDAKSNQQYIKDYNLKVVPSIIKGGHLYSDISQKNEIKLLYN